MAFRQFSRVFMLPKVKYCICKYVQQTKKQWEQQWDAIFDTIG